MSGLTTTWTYDNAGNILKREVYPYTAGTLNPANRISEVNYVYNDDDWGDLLTYDGATYYYITNLQGDVIAILDVSGTAVASYSYDAWGNPITDVAEGTLGFYNPLRYRGYVYDEETGLYYLQSRYYNPEMGRFINGDAFASTGQSLLGNNMFAYCGNNPINAYDPDGMCMRLGFDTIDCRNSSCITSDYYPKPKISHSFGQNTQRDVTTEINEALTKGIDDAKSYIHPKNSLQTIKLYWHFYTLVNHNADWDIKVEESWKKTIGTSFPGYNAYVLYHGISMTPEMLGNYTYGYLGYAYDIPLQVLILGSYYAAGLPQEGPELENELWDWNYINFGYRKAMQDCA